MNAGGITLKSPVERDRMREAGQKLAEVHRRVLAAVKPGVSTLHLDKIANETIRELNCKPAFLGYQGFPATICASVNEQIVHGIPNSAPLDEGDIVGIDIGLIWQGLYSDRATTMPVGRIKPEVMDLLKVTNECLERAIDAARVGNRLFDIGRAVETLAEAHGYGIVQEYSGHGIGRRMHEPPQVPNYVPSRGSDMRGGGNPRLREGMAVAIEPMINMGTHKTKVLSDNWTVVTADGLPSAHFEHTVLITEAGPEVLTGKQPDLKDLELDTN